MSVRELLLVRLELSRRQRFWETTGLAVQGQVVRNVVVGLLAMAVTFAVGSLFNVG